LHFGQTNPGQPIPIIINYYLKYINLFFHLILNQLIIFNNQNIDYLRVLILTI